jgi:hypothetical protein
MELRRIYSPAEPNTPRRVIGVDLFSTGETPEQNWSRRQVLQYVSEGWMRLEGSQIFLMARQDTLVYEVEREPGYYVASTGERIAISELAMGQFMSEPQALLAPAEARAFLASRGLPPNDYTASRNYCCRLNDEQHAKWRSVRDRAGNLVAAHTQEN